MGHLRCDIVWYLGTKARQEERGRTNWFRPRSMRLANGDGRLCLGPVAPRLYGNGQDVVSSAPITPQK